MLLKPNPERFLQIPAVYFVLLTALALTTPLAFAPYYRFWLMPFLFGGFVYLADLKPQRAVLSAYWFAVAGYAAQFWWIHTALAVIAGLPEIFAVPLTLLMPAVLALFPAAAMWLLARCRLPRVWHFALGIPVFWTLAEFVRERFAVNGFGWGALGYSQIADGSPLAGFAPLGGIHLVTFVAACTGSWLALAAGRGSLKTRTAAAAGIAALLAGGHLLRGTAFTQPAGAPVSVALLQGNVPQKLKFDESQYLPTYSRYLDMVAQAKAQIVVLPETALPVFMQLTPKEVLADFARAAELNGSSLAAGMPVFASNGEDYLNAVVNLTGFTAEGQPEKLPMYAKDHLVPFGEYKPMPLLTMPLYRVMNMPLASFKEGGAGQKPLDMAGQKIAFNICYEDGFGDELIASARESTLLANTSNMAWFGASNAMWQQLQQSQARALELGRPMARATNTGATAIVSAQGSIVHQAVPDTTTILTGEMQPMTGETPYMRLGSSLPFIALLLVAAVALKLAFRQPENR